MMVEPALVLLVVLGIALVVTGAVRMRKNSYRSPDANRKTVYQSKSGDELHSSGPKLNEGLRSGR